jgi:signal transduction histidine kinase
MVVSKVSRGLGALTAASYVLFLFCPFLPMELTIPPFNQLTPLTQTRPDDSTYNVGCIIVCHDITDLVQTQEQLRESYEERAKLQASEEGALEASRLKSEFLALTSHELRTPIAHILGLSELLLATEPLTETQKNLAQQSLRSADVLLELVGTVLDMGKIEAGKLDLEIRAFDLNELSGDARFFSTAAKKKGLSFIEDIDTFNVEVMGFVILRLSPFFNRR